MKPALPRPLRYLDGMNNMFYVKQMANPRILSGVVILPGPSDRIVPAVERWIAAHQPGDPEKLTGALGDYQSLLGQGGWYALASSFP